ncbi:MAG: hypothetical protein HQ558_02645 [Candidatus Omnitrophica bacterium]|nr:hypothetical protein [Candidatus Omnitrophota bacterium]
MRKFVVGVLIMSFFASFYVFQQTRLLEYSYHINSNQKSISLLVDQNRQLRYNVARLETPARLENIIIAKKEDETYSLMRRQKIRIGQQRPISAHETAITARPFATAGKFLLNMFSLDTEAIAKELGEQKQTHLLGF